MRVYKFIESKWAKVALREKRLKVSLFNKLNDPFELCAINSRAPHLARFNESAKSYIGKKYGLISYSADYRSPLMWGHYAEQHRGICLGFEVDDREIHKVNYSQDRLDFSNKTSLNRSDVIDIITVKFLEWKYEKEYRSLINLDTAPHANGLFYENFSSKLKLVEVMLGVQNQEQVDTYEKIIRKNYPIDSPVYVTKLSMAKTKFGVTKTIHKPIGLIA